MSNATLARLVASAFSAACLFLFLEAEKFYRFDLRAKHDALARIHERAGAVKHRLHATGDLPDRKAALRHPSLQKDVAIPYQASQRRSQRGPFADSSQGFVRHEGRNENESIRN